MKYRKPSYTEKKTEKLCKTFINQFYGNGGASLPYLEIVGIDNLKFEYNLHIKDFFRIMDIRYLVKRNGFEVDDFYFLTSKMKIAIVVDNGE